MPSGGMSGTKYKQRVLNIEIIMMDIKTTILFLGVYNPKGKQQKIQIQVIENNAMLTSVGVSDCKTKSFS